MSPSRPARDVGAVAVVIAASMDAESMDAESNMFSSGSCQLSDPARAARSRGVAFGACTPWLLGASSSSSPSGPKEFPRLRSVAERGFGTAVEDAADAGLLLLRKTQPMPAYRWAAAGPRRPKDPTSALQKKASTLPLPLRKTQPMPAYRRRVNTTRRRRHGGLRAISLLCVLLLGSRECGLTGNPSSPSLLSDG
ncbi:hypothetical protein VOLCADRAFT_93474 [Volvox carteri f. nagariensis]|uniref:Uncharacterized protein n=1 Tax=Volvox carteri f. nagariensis TaxID=3068 RepID=D8U276_VOLCA|nr:uncharacterized protein VOLCADRAFT_93474 [Volvox carteri f. nagariensis]EFJ46318.1 hypothetical protein VOLCADRAFT_93474 [Volvox carteri f. nagariensis]|eukprot:XP_002952765.1 hypothetical protein VOLCADRAFT_93474 [Volvox carteri f. nagariensis]